MSEPVRYWQYSQLFQNVKFLNLKIIVPVKGLGIAVEVVLKIVSTLLPLQFISKIEN